MSKGLNIIEIVELNKNQVVFTYRGQLFRRDMNNTNLITFEELDNEINELMNYFNEERDVCFI